MLQTPILFSGELPQLVLAGAKWQTRRVVKVPRLPSYEGADLSKAWPDNTSLFGPCLKVPCAGGTVQRIHSPYGEAGDQLWVREAHYRFGHWEKVATKRTRTGRQKWRFVAHDDAGVLFEPPPAGFRNGRHHKDPGTPAWHKRLARFMPRSLARTLLEVTGVRFERFSDISEADILAEGVTVDRVARWLCVPWSDIHDLRTAWKLVWDSINGDRPGCSPEADPWVLALSFRKVSQ